MALTPGLNSVLASAQSRLDYFSLLTLNGQPSKTSMASILCSAAGFVDSNGVKSAWLLEDFIDKEVSPDRQRFRAEKSLLLKIVKIINQYDWSIGFYSTGIRTYNHWKPPLLSRVFHVTIDISL